VAVHVVPASNRTVAKQLAAAAGRAGAVSDARWVRVLDVGSNVDGRTVTAWVVNEWVDGQPLTALLRREPLREPAAAWLVATCARAVAAAHNAGARHGWLHPDEVLITSDGQPRLTGLELHLTLSPDGGYDDVRGLGGLLFAALTGRWPLPGWNGLPHVTRGDGRHPRQQRRSVGRSIDEITAKALSGGYGQAADLARDLSALPQAPLVGSPDDGGRPDLQRWRRAAWWVVPPLLISGIGYASWTAGSDLGKVPGADRSSAPSFPQPGPHRSGAGRLVWTRPPTVTSFDPEGNGTEDPGGVGLAVDGDPSTAWSTGVYHGSPAFGGLKSGVGLLLDLGRPRSVRTARLLLSNPGADIELRAGDRRPTQATDLPVVASRSDSPATLTLPIASKVTARYWLVWITSLPRVATNSYSLSIDEVGLFQ
jgi:hypothetical protein